MFIKNATVSVYKLGLNAGLQTYNPSPASVGVDIYIFPATLQKQMMVDVEGVGNVFTAYSNSGNIDIWDKLVDANSKEYTVKEKAYRNGVLKYYEFTLIAQNA